MFTDPAGQFRFDVPLRLVYQPLESTLSTITFSDLDDPSEVLSIAARHALTPAGATWSEWVGRVASVTGVDRDLLTPLRQGKVAGVLTDFEDRVAGRRAHMFIARGVRIDVQAQHWTAVGVTHPGPSDAFERIWHTLDVPANSYLPALQPEKKIRRLLAAARKDASRGRRESARRNLQEVLRLAQSMYLYSLTHGEMPELPAIQYIVIALSHLFQIGGSILQLRDAEQLACRAYAELGSLPIPAIESAKLRAGLQEMIGHIGQLHPRPPGEEHPEGFPHAGWGTAGLRACAFVFEMERVQAGGGPDAPSLAELCEASVSDHLAWQFGLESTIRDEWQAGSLSKAEIAQVARLKSRLRVFPNLATNLLTLTGLRSHENDLLGSSEASALAVEVARDVASDEGWRRHAVEHGLPDPAATLAQALCLHASSLWAMRDEQSIADAETDLAAATRIADELADEGELRAQICRQQAGIYLEAQRTDEALDVIERGLRACRNLPHLVSAEVGLRIFRAQCLLNAGDITGAEAVLKDLRFPSGGDQFALQHMRADAMFTAAAAHDALGHTEQALDGLVGALAAIFKLSAFSELAVRMLMYASALEISRRFELSVKLNFAAIAALEVRRAALGSSEYQVDFDEAPLRQKAYGDLAAYLMLIDGARAMAVADLGRARVLADLLGLRAEPGKAAAPAESPPELAASEPDQGLEIAADYVRRSAENVLRQRGNPPQMTADAVRGLSRAAGCPILMIQPFAQTVALFLLSPSGKVLTALSSARLDEVRADSERVSQALRIFTVPRGGPDVSRATAADPAAVLSGALHRLWQALIEPVAAGLPECGPLILVPYRDLTLVPYALLEDEHGNRLVDRLAIGVAPSLAVLHELIRRGPYRGSPQRVYLAGDPAVDPGHFLPPLGGALNEVRNIHDRLTRSGVSRSRIMLRHGASATLESYRSEARHCDLVHLACHGRLEEPAASSRLYLAPGQSDDGLLLAAEASEVPLDDALVFLSACQTGQGRATADGVIGFGQAFLQAGARVVIASLWKVADAAASVLADHFYNALLTGSPVSAAAALQSAMLALRDDLSAGRVIEQDGTRLTSEPVNWAAFFAFGDALSTSYSEVKRPVEMLS